MDRIDRHSDTESESSIPEVLTRDHIREFDDGNLLHSTNGPEQLSVNQRFSEMNSQITELTNLVLILTEKISSSNREGNDLNTVSIGHETRSDKANHYSSKEQGRERVKSASRLKVQTLNVLLRCSVWLLGNFHHFRVPKIQRGT